VFHEGRQFEKTRTDVKRAHLFVHWNFIENPRKTLSRRLK